MARRHGTKGHCPEPLQKARFKKRTITRELPTKNWMHVARYISSREELLEFINLWVLLMNVNLNEEEHDSIGGNGQLVAITPRHLLTKSNSKDPTTFSR
jgi:hypothetical protein